MGHSKQPTLTSSSHRHARASIRPDPSRLSRTKSQAPTSAHMEASSNMVLSSEIRSSVTQTRVAEMFKDKALESLKEAEGGSTVEAAVKLHADALMTAMAAAMTSGTAIGKITLDDMKTAVETALGATDYDTDYFRIAWERHMQAGMRGLCQQQITDTPQREILQKLWPLPPTGPQLMMPVAPEVTPEDVTARTLFDDKQPEAGVSNVMLDEF
eukprot:SAG31_NODE_3091_length_4683_cov_47.153578_1_plen_213_part_00